MKKRSWKQLNMAHPAQQQQILDGSLLALPGIVNQSRQFPKDYKIVNP